MPWFRSTGVVLCAVALCGCGVTHHASAPAGPADPPGLSIAKLAGPPSSYMPRVASVPMRLSSLRAADPAVLRPYLRSFQRANRAFEYALIATDPNDELDNLDVTPGPRAARASPAYAAAARVYARYAGALTAMAPSASLMRIHRIYIAGVRRQEADMQTFSDALRGTDAQGMEQSMEQLERSQLRFDVESHAWDRAVKVVSLRSGVTAPAWLSLVG